MACLAFNERISRVLLDQLVAETTESVRRMHVKTVFRKFTQTADRYTWILDLLVFSVVLGK